MSHEKNGRSLLEIVREYATSEQLSLPVFPGVAVELQQIMSEDELPPIDQVAKIISKDQALASQVLKLSNSAFFSGLNKVRTIRDALMRLGINQVFNCLVVSSQRSLYSSRDVVIDKYLKELWKHALATAIGTKWLLKKTGYPDLGDEGFLAGLLHDIGKLLLLRVIEHLKQDNAELDLSEVFISEILESMHVEQGYNLMEEWCIPLNYCIVARDHHLEEFDPSDVLLLAVRVVNQVCRKVGLSLKPENHIVPATLPEAHALGVKEIMLAELEIALEDAAELELAI